MNLAPELLLRKVFEWKGNFSEGNKSARKEWDGVVIAPFRDNAPAAVSISGDLEMCWGWRNRPQEECEERGARERDNVPYLVRLFEEYAIPVTWATVGHLFLDKCRRGDDGLAHGAMLRPPVNRGWSGDWYRHDPCSDLSRAPGWYAPDLADLILSSRVPHEIGTHSFSHIDFSRETSTPELVRAEIEASAEAMSAFGVQPRSLVFCHNHMGHQHPDLLYDLGIVAVRHRDPKVRLAYPERTGRGVYRICESMNLRIASHYEYVDKARLFIDEAISRGAAYHIWFHPSDERAVFERALRPVLELIEGRRRSGRVWVTTMAELSGYCEAREKATIGVEHRSDGITLKIDCDLDRARFGSPTLTLMIPAERQVATVVGHDGADIHELAAKQPGPTREEAYATINVPCRTKSVEIRFA